MRRLSLLLLLVLVGCERSQPEYWQGYIEGEYVLLAAPQAGQLQNLQVRRGDQVERGAPVFVLEQEAERAARREAEERLRSAQARLQNLETGRRPAELDALRAEVQQAAAARTLSASQLAQEEKLFKGGFISQARLDEARTAHERDVARLAQAQAQLANAQQPLGRDAERKAAQGEVAAARAALAQSQWRLEQKSIAAPVSGLVQDTFFVEGEWVAAGRPVASILPPGNVKARFYVPQAVLGHIAVGAPVEIRCDGCAAPVAAQVSYLSAQAEYTPPVLYSREGRAKLVYLVEARPAPGDAAQLRPGQPIEVVPLPR
jgi:HlyD family secretion protein